MSLSSLPPVAPGGCRLFIRDLRVQLRLGVRPLERLRTRDAIVNIALDVRKSWQDAPERLDETVCYETIANQIHAMFHGRQVALVEAMAERIAAFCLQHDERVLAVWVRVEKPGAVAVADAVAVETALRRSDEKPRRSGETLVASS